MTGIILVAGYGSRLGDITKDTPKCLIDISGKCSLGRMLENFRYSGITNVIIVTGFQCPKIMRYVEKDEFNDLDILTIWNENWKTTNNAYSLNLALEETNDDIIVANGDVVCYKDLIKDLVEHKSANAMAIVRKKELNEEDMKVVVYMQKVLIVSKELPPHSSFGEFTGIFKMAEENISLFKNDLHRILLNNSNAWFEHGLEIICKSGFMSCVDVSHYPYIEIDFPSDLEEARDRFPYNDPVWEQGGRHHSLKENKRDLNDAWALSFDFINLLNKYKIRYWFNWGALLGIIREQNFLKQDTDIDICVDKKNEDLLWEKVVPEMKKLRCFVPNREDHCDNDLFIIRDGERIECNTMEKIGEKYVYSPKRCNLYCPSNYLDELTGTIIKGKYISIPKYAEEMLCGWYGNWRTPSNTKPKSF